MRRIYESGALRRDDEDPYRPGERDERAEPQAMRTVPGGLASRLLVPRWLRFRALSVEVSTPRTEYDPGSPVPFAVEIENALPFPITVPTVSPVLWNWDVDGLTEASHVYREPPDEQRGFRFDRGERKRFTRRWPQAFRVSDSEWEPAEPGEYTIGAGLNVDDPDRSDLRDETTVRVLPE